MHVCQNPFEEDQENSQFSTLALKHCYKDVWSNFFHILKGDTDIMCRSANILHVLGSVSVSTAIKLYTYKRLIFTSQALCCVDKKGILSWPNPVPEKVFFLRNGDSLSQTSRFVKCVYFINKLKHTFCVECQLFSIRLNNLCIKSLHIIQ